MDPICPLLTLGGDPRVVSAMPDAAHRCSAGGTPTMVERDYQARFCLGSAFETCERYVAHVEQFGPIGPTWRPAAPDASFVSTRVVLEAAPRKVMARRPRRVGRTAVLIVGLVLAGVVIGVIGLGGLGGLLGPPVSTPSPSPSVSASPSASEAASPSVEPSPSASAALTPAPTPAPAATPLTYIVQAGDTLNEIAARFGTTAQAIMAANGLTSEIINIGQVLIIPQ